MEVGMVLLRTGVQVTAIEANLQLRSSLGLKKKDISFICVADTFLFTFLVVLLFVYF